MESPAAVTNPFALMTSPETVFAAIERSERLARLKSTICRPLDKPRPEKPAVELRAYDDEVEAMEMVVDADFAADEAAPSTTQQCPAEL